MVGGGGWSIVGSWFAPPRWKECVSVVTHPVRKSGGCFVEEGQQRYCFILSHSIYPGTHSYDINELIIRRRRLGFKSFQQWSSRSCDAHEGSSVRLVRSRRRRRRRLHGGRLILFVTSIRRQLRARKCENRNQRFMFDPRILFA